MEGKTVIVTGAASGIGRAIAVGLARAGASVVVADINIEGAKNTAADIQKEGGRAEAVFVDVSDRESVQQLVNATIAAYDHIDYLVNNVGILTRYSFLDLPEEDWDRILDVNLKGMFLCGQAVASHMIQRGGGAIVNMSSTAAEIVVSRVHYVSSKGGVRQLTKAMALELAPYKIRVNAVAPGTIRTPMNEQRLSDPEVMKAELKRIPLGRVGVPEDLVGPVKFLLSDDAAYITGATLLVDGGYTLH